MKKLIAALALIALAGCTSQTAYGTCIGAFDEGDPKLVYKTNVWNVAMGVIFFEFIIPPVIVIADETKCPVGRK